MCLALEMPIIGRESRVLWKFSWALKEGWGLERASSAEELTKARKRVVQGRGWGTRAAEHGAQAHGPLESVLGDLFDFSPSRQ